MTKNIICTAVFLSLSCFFLISCEDETGSADVTISIEPSIPEIYDIPYDDSTDEHLPNWFPFQLSFNNQTSNHLVIQDVTFSYRFGEDTAYINETELTVAESQTAAYFIDIPAGTSGLEHQIIKNDTNATAFTRILSNLAQNPDFSGDKNYYCKLEFQGYFANSTGTTAPEPTTPIEKFSKTIYFRTKAKQ